MIIQGASLSFLLSFTSLQWFLLIAAAVTNLLSSTTKFIAYKLQNVSDLQKLAFLPNVWQFCIDITFMHAVFSGLELAGFIALFVFYGGYLSYVAVTTCAKKDHDAEDDFYKQDDIEIGDASTSTVSSLIENEIGHDSAIQKESVLTSKKQLANFI